MDITCTCCTSGSAVLKNIQFKAGSIDPSIGRTSIEAKNRILFCTARPIIIILGVSLLSYTRCKFTQPCIANCVRVRTCACSVAHALVTHG